MLNAPLSWTNILLGDDVLCKEAAADAASLFESSTFTIMDDSQNFEPQFAADYTSHHNGFNNEELASRLQERAAAGAEPLAKRARIDLTSEATLTNGTDNSEEKTFTELTQLSSVYDVLNGVDEYPSTSSFNDAPTQSNADQEMECLDNVVEQQPTTSEAPRNEEMEYLDNAVEEQPTTSEAPRNEVVDSLLMDMDCEPSTSRATAAPADGEEEEEWADYYYELSDPHENLISELRAKMAELDKELKDINEECTAAIIEKATIDDMIQKRKAPKYKNPGVRDHVVYVCFICSRAFFTKEDMRDHVQKSHLNPGNDRDYKCRFCRRAFSRRQRLEEHEQKHKTPASRYECSMCSQSYNTKDALEIHYSSAHGRTIDGEAINAHVYDCEHCGKTFGVQKELQYHLYYCSRKDEISEKRAKKRELDVSRPGSAGVSPALPTAKLVKDKSCPVCGLVCASVQSRDRHVGRKHPQFDMSKLNLTPVYSPSREILAARPFACTTCDAHFTTAAGLSTHCRRIHDADPSKMYTCSKCGKVYPLMSELRKHEKKNEGRAMCLLRGSQSNGGTPRSVDSMSRGSSLAPRTPHSTPMSLTPRGSTNAVYAAVYTPNPERKRKRKQVQIKDEDMKADEESAVSDEVDKVDLKPEINNKKDSEPNYDTLDDFVF